MYIDSRKCVFFPKRQLLIVKSSKTQNHFTEFNKYFNVNSLHIQKYSSILKQEYKILL